ncbi:MAG: TonB-dependent receptor plug domain-containing protein [Pseudomonadota bacterium]
MTHRHPARRCALRLVVAAAALLPAQPVLGADTPGLEGEPSSLGSVGRPVHVVGRDALFATGETDLGAALGELVPAFRYASPLATNGDDHVRTGTLRGLAPDQMVVLVNGKRQHTSSKFYTANQAGRGSVGVDLALLPMSAVARVEVRSGGAGGRFGSGAQAGVINIVLDDSDQGGRFHGSFGQRRSAIEGVPRLMGTNVNDEAGTIDLALSGNLTEDDGSGDDLSLQGSWGFELGNEGFMRLSAEYQEREASNRAGYDRRRQYPLNPDGSFDVRERTVDRRRDSYGDPAHEELNILFNAEVPVAGRTSFYGFTFLGTRNATSDAPFVRPVDDRNVPDVYPDGFLPEIESDTDDRSFTLGFRGERWGWNWDLSYNQREDELDLGVNQSLNPTFGELSPTTFVVGNNETKRITMRLDLGREWQPRWLAGTLNTEAGIATVEEEYEIETGEPAAAFDAGRSDPAALPVRAAVVGFPGFPLEVERSRETFAAYAGATAELIDSVTVEASARLDDMDDLGSEVSADLAAEWALTEAMTLRGAVGRGFHAPSLAQVTYTRTVDTVTAAGTRQAGVFQSDSPVATALGGAALEEQTATHGSLGIGFRPFDQLEAAVDLWQVEIDDRVVLSRTLSGGGVDAALLAAGLGDVTSARFTANAVDVRARGIDARVRYLTPLFDGELELDLGATHQETDVTGARSFTTAAGDVIDAFDGRARAQLEDAQPDTKAIAGAVWQRGGFTLGTRLTRVSGTTDYGDTPAQRLDMDSAWLVDLDMGYRVSPQIQFSVGVHNALNEYPETLPVGDGLPSAHERFPYSGYAGYDAAGRLMYARASFDVR